jgi:hypothetical protein
LANCKGANAVNLSKTCVVIVGAGQAGGRAADALRAAGHVGLIGEEAHLPYERPQLSKSILLDSEPNSTFIRTSDANIQIVGHPAMRSSGKTSPMASAASPSTLPATCPFCAVSSRRERPFSESILKTRILN